MFGNHILPTLLFCGWAPWFANEQPSNKAIFHAPCKHELKETSELFILSLRDALKTGPMCDRHAFLLFSILLTLADT